MQHQEIPADDYVNILKPALAWPDSHINIIFQDITLESDPAELKELLKECGLKTGEILDIKTFLVKWQGRRDACSSSKRGQ